jgi:hypothetical protein
MPRASYLQRMASPAAIHRPLLPPRGSGRRAAESRLAAEPAMPFSAPLLPALPSAQLPLTQFAQVRGEEPQVEPSAGSAPATEPLMLVPPSLRTTRTRAADETAQPPPARARARGSDRRDGDESETASEDALATTSPVRPRLWPESVVTAPAAEVPATVRPQTRLPALAARAASREVIEATALASRRLAASQQSDFEPRDVEASLVPPPEPRVPAIQASRRVTVQPRTPQEQSTFSIGSIEVHIDPPKPPEPLRPRPVAAPVAEPAPLARDYTSRFGLRQG